MGRWIRGKNPMPLEDVICFREVGNAVVEGVKQEWVWHSPAGFE